MSRLFVHLPLCTALAFGAATALAQPSQATGDAPDYAAGSATGPATPAKSKAPPVASPSTAAMLAAGMPHYEPPKPATKPKPEETPVDLREVDKPKNGIIRLPNFVVKAAKPPIFREQDLYTKDGLSGVAMHRYAGLNLGPFSDLNAPIAIAMYQEDERLKEMSELSDTAAAMSRGGDASEAAMVRQLSQDTYARPMEFGGPAPGNPSARP